MNANKVLACVDQSRFADYVADYAAWSARRLRAPLEFLHVIDRHPEIGTGEDHSGAIGVSAQENLLTELTEKDAAAAKSAREQGRVFLNRLRERAAAAGAASIDVRQRHGSLEETLAELENTVELFVLGRRGQSANTTQRDLGRNVERIVRSLQRPILTVTEGFNPPERALIAFDGSGATRRGVEFVAGSPLFAGMPVHIVMSGEKSGGSSKPLDWARGILESAGISCTVALVPGDAEGVIARAVREHGIDVLIMGAYTHSRLRSLLFGSKTSDLLRSSKIPTLLIR
jgi:nucleotide-binding universal stress UspA family protein